MQFDPDRHGKLHKLDDGRIMVAWERRLGHSVDKVWRAITDEAELRRWFPGIQIEKRRGGKFSINFDGDCDGPEHVSGVVEVYDPPNELKLGGMHYQLEATESGCLLRFSDILMFDQVRTRQEFAISVLGGWHSYLDKLEAALAGTGTNQAFPEPPYSSISVPGWEHL